MEGMGRGRGSRFHTLGRGITGFVRAVHRSKNINQAQLETNIAYCIILLYGPPRDHLEADEAGFWFVRYGSTFESSSSSFHCGFDFEVRFFRET